jgi:hypothetical protein
MVEVDVHALELEVGSTVVPNELSAAQSPARKSALNLLSITIETVLAGDGLPVFQSVNCDPMTRKKSFDIYLHVPEGGTNLVTLLCKPNLVPTQEHFHVDIHRQGRTYTLAGLEVNLWSNGG